MPTLEASLARVTQEISHIKRIQPQHNSSYFFSSRPAITEDLITPLSSLIRSRPNVSNSIAFCQLMTSARLKNHLYYSADMLGYQLVLAGFIAQLSSRWTCHYCDYCIRCQFNQTHLRKCVSFQSKSFPIIQILDL